MPWPSPQDYNEAVQTPAISFADGQLQSGSPELNSYGLPKAVSGAFASVYRLHTTDGDWAIRCFLQQVADQEQRYNALCDFICHDDLECTVPFVFMKEGVRVHSSWFPALKMQWVAGDTLNVFLQQHLGDGRVLQRLADNFKDMCAQLSRNGIAHGDLQHGNIMLLGENLRLVDYDGMYVPQLKGWQSNELGHRNYQHPSRQSHHFGSYLDNFSAWVIYTSIFAISRNPALWADLKGGDECLLFRQADYKGPQCSLVFSVLEHCPDEEVVRLARSIRALLALPVERVPGLDGIVDTSALPMVPPPEVVRKQLEERAARPTQMGAGWISGWSDTDDSGTGVKVQSTVRINVQPHSAASSSVNTTTVQPSPAILSMLQQQLGQQSQASGSTSGSYQFPHVYPGPTVSTLQQQKLRQAAPPVILDLADRYASNSNSSGSSSYAPITVENLIGSWLLFMGFFFLLFLINLGSHSSISTSDPVSADYRSLSSAASKAAATDTIPGDDGTVTTGSADGDQTAADSALTVDPAIRNLMSEAYQYARQGNYALAVTTYTICIKKYQYANAYYDRALAYEKIGRSNDALADFNQYIKKLPNDAQAYRERAALELKMNMTDRANEDLRYADRLAPPSGPP